MSNRINAGMALALTFGLGAGAAIGSVGRTLWVDALGDVTARRTDSGADGAMIAGGTLPDLLSVSLIPWLPASHADPYTGLPDTGPSANIVRIDVVFSGLVNPPGPLGLNGTAYEPGRHGPSPVYGFIEIDVDNDRDTGGEFAAQARSRTLGLSGRFGGRIADPLLVDRVPTSAADLDVSWLTPPYFERTGTDFALAMCGCFESSIAFQDGNCDDRLDPGETMIVSGRFFQRAGGYRLASQIVGGSDVGLYDPIVNMRFTHEPTSNLTVVTLVFPLTPAGAAALACEPEQPIDSSIGSGSHFSIAEALADLVSGANAGASGLTNQLIQRWSKKDPSDYLNPLMWNAAAIVGTAYAEPEDALYVWTDTGFQLTRGDTDGDGVVTPNDRAAVEWFVAFNDGSAIDVDGTVNGIVTLDNIGPNFSLFDVTGDGAVSEGDVNWFEFPSACRADWDRNGAVEVADIFAFLASWFAGNADFDGDGVTEVPDIFAFLADWFAGPCI